MHRFHVHPEEVNSERQRRHAQRKKSPWTDEEDLHLLELAAENWDESQPKKTLLAKLHHLIPSRSMEAIKKRLQHLKWTRPATGLVSPPLNETKKSAAPKGWTQEEEGQLMETAARVWEEGMTKAQLALKVHASCSKRSVEAIKKRLLLLKWKPPTMKPAQAVSLQSPSAAAEEVEYNSWRHQMLDTILGLQTDGDGWARELRSVALELTDDSVTLSVARQRIKCILDQVFTDQWSWRGQRKQTSRGALTKRQIRRAQYGAIQKLYNVNKKEAAKAVLDGRWRESHQPQAAPVEGLGDYWAEVLSREGPHGEIHQQNVPQLWSILDPINTEELTESIRTLRSSAGGVDKISAAQLLTWDQPSLAVLVNSPRRYHRP